MELIRFMKIEWNKQSPAEALQIMTKKEFKLKYPEMYSASILGRVSSNLKYCQALMYQNVISGIFIIPKKEHPIREHIQFAFALSHDTMVVICSKTSEIKKLLDQFCEQYDITYTHPLLFLLEFMMFLTSEDVYFLEEYNDKLESIEQLLFRGKKTDMEEFTLACREDMNVLSNYYLQLSAVGETMEEVAMDSDLELPSSLTSLYSARISQLSSIVSDIKAHTSQIWNLKQTQLSDLQNRISTTLTIITVIFLPLTMITGWFGMNFTNMPAIHSKFGYPVVICAVVIIVICELLYFKFSPSIQNVYRHSSMSSDSFRSLSEKDKERAYTEKYGFSMNESLKKKRRKKLAAGEVDEIDEPVPSLPANMRSAAAAAASLDQPQTVSGSVYKSGSKPAFHHSESDLMLEDSVRKEMEAEHPDLPHCFICEDGHCEPIGEKKENTATAIDEKKERKDLDLKEKEQKTPKAEDSSKKKEDLSNPDIHLL